VFLPFFKKTMYLKNFFRSFSLKPAILWSDEIYLDGTLTFKDEAKAMQDTPSINSKLLFPIEDLTPEQRQILMQNLLISSCCGDEFM
jgi:hypothetical protein